MAQIMRLDKFLADMKFGTRSEVKKLIKEKRVIINDIIIDKADHKVNEDTVVYVDDVPVHYVSHEYYLLNKPAGYLCTLDGSPNVVELIDGKRKDLSPCGRLDRDTEGLIIITNDGQLIHRLLSPRHEVKKTYYLETEKALSANAEEILTHPIEFADFTSQPAEYEKLTANSALLTISEGKYHQVKRMIEKTDNLVTYLKRIRFAFLTLEGLKTGEYRPLSSEEIEELSKL